MLIIPLTVDEKFDFYVFVIEVKKGALGVDEPLNDTLVFCVIGFTRDKHVMLESFSRGVDSQHSLSMGYSKTVFYISGIKDKSFLVESCIDNIRNIFSGSKSDEEPYLNDDFCKEFREGCGDKKFAGRFINEDDECIGFDHNGCLINFVINDKEKISIDLTSASLGTTSSHVYGLSLDDFCSSLINGSLSLSVRLETLLPYLPITFMFIHEQLCKALGNKLELLNLNNADTIINQHCEKIGISVSDDSTSDYSEQSVKKQRKQRKQRKSKV